MPPTMPRRPDRPTKAGTAKGPDVHRATARGPVAGSRAAGATSGPLASGGDVQGGRPAALPSPHLLEAKRGSVG